MGELHRDAASENASMLVQGVENIASDRMSERADPVHDFGIKLLHQALFLPPGVVQDIAFHLQLQLLSLLLGPQLLVVALAFLLLLRGEFFHLRAPLYLDGLGLCTWSGI